jgi:hypothetical protein
MEIEELFENVFDAVPNAKQEAEADLEYEKQRLHFEQWYAKQHSIGADPSFIFSLRANKDSYIDPRVDEFYQSFYKALCILCY